MKKLWIILILPLLLVACESGDKKKSDESKTDKQAEKAFDKGEKGNEEGNKDKKKKDESKTNGETEPKKYDRKAKEAKRRGKKVPLKKNDKEDSETNKILSEEKIEEYHQKALDYVKSMGEYYIVYDEYGDFNADFYDDGKMEGIVFIQDDTNITDVLVLDVEGSEAKLISKYNILNLEDEFEFNDIVFHSAGLIYLDGFDMPVPFVERNEREDSTGYIFFRIVYDTIEPFIDTTSLCDVGTTDLIDTNDDGDYDKYTVNNWGYDVFYYPLSMTYLFNAPPWTFESGYIELGERPQSPTDVVKEYMYLSYLKDVYRNLDGSFCSIENLDERLNDLSDVQFTDKYIFSAQLLQDTALEMEHKANFVEDLGEEFTDVTVYPPESPENMDSTTIFTLVKLDGKWIIMDIYYPEEMLEQSEG